VQSDEGENVAQENDGGTCTPGERKMLDAIAKADAVFILADGGFGEGGDDSGPQTITWMRCFSERPSCHFEIDYGHLPPEGDEKWGERVVRRVKVTMGLTAKQFADAVRRGQESDAA
jgi:hypothetical protein